VCASIRARPEPLERTIKQGNTCAAGGCCISGSPANSCKGCPYCCRVQNPSFSKQCALNTVLILDNTASLDPYCSSVKPAVASFVNGLNNIVNAGGSVKLGVLLFKENPFVVWDMTTVTASFLTSVQNWVGTATTNGGTVTGVFPSGTQVGGYCTNTGYTNWAAALYLAAQWPWAGVPVPDIYIWFTDGEMGFLVLSVGPDLLFFNKAFPSTRKTTFRRLPARRAAIPTPTPSSVTFAPAAPLARWVAELAWAACPMAQRKVMPRAHGPPALQRMRLRQLEPR
jgi:hypothetical protein